MPSPSYKKIATQHKKSRLSLLLYSALAMVVNSAVNYQLILRLFMSLVRFDFLSKMKLALSPSNVCNRVEGMQGLDQWLACIVFACAAFIFLPLVYEIGKAVVQSLPPSVPASSQKGTADYRIKQLSVATDVIRSYRKKMGFELDAIMAQGQGRGGGGGVGGGGRGGDRKSADEHQFRAFDVALWFPSFIAPDLWICWLSNAIIRRAQQSIPRDLLVVQDSDKAQTQRRMLSVCKETSFVLSRLPYCLSPDSLFVSVLVPVHEDDDYHYDANANDASTKRFESQPSFVELEARLKLLPSSSDQQQESPRIQQSLEFRRWMNHCRRHQLPPYNELIELYNSNLGDFTGAFKALPLYLTMGLTDHLANPVGRAVVRQVALNFLVFLSSSLGWWSEYTRDYYGVTESVQIMSLSFSASSSASARPREIVEHWDEYTETWAAVIGPRAILFQVVPYLTPLMTYTKIMATSPWIVTDPNLLVPSYLDVGSFFRKARRDVYHRDDPVPVAQATDDNQEWAVFLEAWHAFGTKSRLSQRVFNLFTLLLCFGLLATGFLSSAGSIDPSGLQKMLLAVSLLFYGLFNCFKALKVVSLLGKVLKITDADLLPFTRGLKERNDDKCNNFDPQAVKFREAETSRKSLHPGNRERDLDNGHVEMLPLSLPATADRDSLAATLRDSIPSRLSVNSSQVPDQDRNQDTDTDTNAVWLHVNPMVVSSSAPTEPPAALQDKRLNSSGDPKQLLSQSIYHSSQAAQHSPLHQVRGSGRSALGIAQPTQRPPDPDPSQPPLPL